MPVKEGGKEIIRKVVARLTISSRHGGALIQVRASIILAPVTTQIEIRHNVE
jgi:hypothetical protein